MASNLNKAFMRAYAKDRSATAAEPTAPSTAHAPVAQTPTTQPLATPTYPQPLAAQPLAAQPLANQPHVMQARVTQPPAVARPAINQPPVTSQVSSTPAPQYPNTAQPSIAQPIPRPRATVLKPQSTFAATQAAQNQPSVAERITRPAPPTARPVTAPVNQANDPSMTRPIGQPLNQRITRPVNQAVSQPSSQPNSQPSSQPSSQPAPAAPTAPAAADTVSQVWRRIDAAHQAQSHQPTTLPDRPTAAVAAGNVPAPRRIRTAASPTPTSAPAATPNLRIDHAPPVPDQRLPLLGDDAADPVENQSTDTRRRTVADFLYSAGQYNPGRILASAEHSERPAAAATAMPAMPMRASDAVRSHEESHYAMSGQGTTGQPLTSQTSQPMANQPMPGQQAYSPAYTSYQPETMSPTIEEPMPRRMGQILRVDVPRNAPVSNPIANPASNPVPMPVAAPATTARVATTAAAPMIAASTEGVQLEAPVAKYVIEQRRLDRAHKITAAEDKLRQSTHKIFNPVWEVDNLQWPNVVDKLMQQRADSMAHVAAHMKSACEDGMNILGVTSAEAGEGRTTVACCLARLAAAHGLNVCLVDLDLDRPTVCMQTNMEVEHDWRDCLASDITLEEVAVHSIDDQLTVVPLKPRGDRPGLLASDGRIAQVLGELSESFELVIVDCSRTASSGNVITGLAHTKIFDAAIVVVDRRDTHQDRVEDAVRMIQQTGIESIGIVDNFSM